MADSKTRRQDVATRFIGGTRGATEAWPRATEDSATQLLMKSRACDIFIAGAGIAGCAAAIALASAGWHVVVADRPGPVLESGETLPSSARPLLERLGVWEGFLRLGALRVDTDATWGERGGERSNVFSPYGPDWVVPKGDLIALLRVAAMRASATFCGARVGTIEATGSGPGARFAIQLHPSHVAWTARAILDATGRQARAARQLGARREVWDRQAAALWHVPENPQRAWSSGRTLVRSHAGGWWYAATLPRGGWALSSYYYPDRAARGRGRFALESAPEWARSSLDADPNPARLAAGSTRLSPCAGPGWAAIGDAACALDPLASAGMLTALRTALRAAAAIAADLAGHSESLRQYARMLDELVGHYAERRRRIQASVRHESSGFWRAAATHPR